MSTKKITVIGGGLAGLYAAHSAALSGAEVTLYEKGKIGSKHNCGEMFAEVYTTVPEECVLNRIEFFDIHVGGELIVVEVGEGDSSPFVMTDKCKHELIMYKKCLELGVKFVEKTKISNSLKLNGYTIDCTGTSNYKMRMGKALVNVVKRTIPLDTNTAVFKIRDDLMGYSWIFPRGNDMLNIGDGVLDYKYNTKLELPIKVSPSDIIYKGGGLLPMPTMEDYYTSLDEWTMTGTKAGNAAGLCSPIAGGGEHLAVISGMLAGELVSKGRDAKYKEALDDIIGDEMRLGISLYQFMRKQDMDSVKKIMKKEIMRCVDRHIIDKSIRKCMKKWITIAPVCEKEMEDFIR